MNHTIYNAGVNLFAAAPPAVTTDSMNDVFANSINVLTTNADATTSAGGSVLLGIATIEVIIFLYGSYMAGSLNDVVKTLIEKVFFIFVVALLFFNWGAAANWVKGYVVGGASAAGGASSMVQTLNPAYIASEGFDKVSVIFNSEAQEKMTRDLFGTNPEAEKRRAARERAEKMRANQGYIDSFKSTANGMRPTAMMETLVDGLDQFALQVTALLLFSTLGLLIVGVYMYCGIMMFVISIEWYIVVTLTKLLIPFAINKHTSGLATAAVNAVWAKSIQLGVLVLVLAMFGKSLSALSLGPSPTLYEVLALLGTSATMAFCVSRVPAIAASVFAGAGSGLDVGSALAAAGAAVAGGAASALTPKQKNDDPNGSGGGGGGADGAKGAAAKAASAIGGVAGAAAGRVGGVAKDAASGAVSKMTAGLPGAAGKTPAAASLSKAQKNLAGAQGRLGKLAGSKASPSKVASAVGEVASARASVDAIKSTPEGALASAKADLAQVSTSPDSTPEELESAVAGVASAERELAQSQLSQAHGEEVSNSNALTAMVADPASVMEARTADQAAPKQEATVMSMGEDGNVIGSNESSSGAPEPDQQAIPASNLDAREGMAAVASGSGAGVYPAVNESGAPATQLLPVVDTSATPPETDADSGTSAPGVGARPNDWADASLQRGGEGGSAGTTSSTTSNDRADALPQGGDDEEGS